MGVLNKFFAPSPFANLKGHSEKVHECVLLLQPLVDAILDNDHEKMDKLHYQMSKTEHEADIIKTELRDRISKMMFMSVGKADFSKILSYQDDIADAAEDFSVVLTLRNTEMHKDLKEDFKALAKQVIKVSEQLMKLCENISALAEAAFSGEEAQDMLKEIENICKQEWQVDKLERKFARHFYSLEDQLSPVDVMFMEKYCKTLSRVSNNAEKTAKYLRIIIRTK